MSIESSAAPFTAREPGAEPIYAAAQQWRSHCLELDGSVFRNRALWTRENVEALHTAVVENPLEHTRSFSEELKEQLASSTPEVQQLAAEMLWLMMLFPTNLRPQTKVNNVTEVWSQSGETLSATDPGLKPLREPGIGNTGQGFNQYRWKELAYLIRLLQKWKTMDKPGRTAVGDIWSFSDWVSAGDHGEVRQMRHILLHLLFPDSFEPITSLAHKHAIRIAFGWTIPEDMSRVAAESRLTGLDQDLWQIRKVLQARSPNRRIDFYDPELRKEWQPEPQREEGEGAKKKPGRPVLSANAIRALGYALALERHRETTLGTDSNLVVLGCMLSATAEGRRDTSMVIVQALQRANPEALGDKPTPDAVLALYQRVLPFPVGGVPEPVDPPVDILDKGSSDAALDQILTDASKLAFYTSSSAKAELSTRHLLGSILGLGAIQPAQRALQQLGVDLSELRGELFEFFRRTLKADDLGVWRELLLGDVEPQPTHVQAGYVADDPRGPDHLGITEEVNAFASVLAARDVSPPLSVGLFGDWGTGKSFFMHQLEARITHLADRARAAREQGGDAAYCTRVVQIWFNAWHYIDANLWASLATEIFESLALALADGADTATNADDVRRRLFGDLEASRGLLAEAERRKAGAEAEEASAKARLDALKQRESGILRQIGDATANVEALWNVGREHPAVAQLLAKAADTLEVPEAALAGKALKEHAEQLRGLWGSVRMGFHIMTRKRSRWIGVALWLAVAGVAALLLRQLLIGIGINRISTALTAGSAWLAALGAAVKPWIDRARKAADTLKQADAEMDKQEGARRESLERERDRLENAATKLAVAVAEAEQQRLTAERRVAEVETEIEEIRAGRRLERFVHERSGTDDYRRHLGIVAVIRRDFQRLCELLTAAREAGDALPAVDRIILYVDDLDRCPEKRVVEVLQAIHLLLAFPLFVVVVGVDSRWLLRSVRSQYAGLLGETGRSRDARADAPDWNSEGFDPEMWSSTPQNYLEKIFQIPYSLRPMDEGGFGKLLGSLLPVRFAEKATQVPVEKVFPDPASTDEGWEPLQPEVARSEWPVAEDEPGLQNAEDGSLRPVWDDDDPMEDMVDEHDPEMAPAALELDSAELEYLARLSPLIGSPRAAKRFANLYRFLRAGLSGAALDRFRGSARRPGEHRAAALLLAILTGHPVEGAQLLRRLAQTDPAAHGGFAEFLSSLPPAAASGEEGEAAATGLQRLRTAVSQTDGDGAAPPLEAFVRWAPRVARFSFRTAAEGSAPAR
jgi:hypothetical protein